MKFNENYKPKDLGSSLPTKENKYHTTHKHTNELLRNKTIKQMIEKIYKATIKSYTLHIGQKMTLIFSSKNMQARGQWKYITKVIVKKIIN